LRIREKAVKFHRFFLFFATILHFEFCILNFIRTFAPLNTPEGL